MQNKKTYFLLIFILVISGVSYYLSRNEELLKILFAIPFVGSLIGAILQILKDQAAFDRALILQETGNQFVLGAGSHMGNIAFNKHVEFSEEYVLEAQSALITLMTEGPSKKVLEHCPKLHNIRQKYIVWLAIDLEESLDPFEQTLGSIGASAFYLDLVRGSEKSGEVQSKALEKMYNEFAQVMGFDEWNGKKLSNELAIATLVRKLRLILGTEELMALRVAILKKASGEIKKNS